jgi:hypothetical protein
MGGGFVWVVDVGWWVVVTMGGAVVGAWVVCMVSAGGSSHLHHPGPPLPPSLVWLMTESKSGTNNAAPYHR